MSDPFNSNSYGPILGSGGAPAYEPMGIPGLPPFMQLLMAPFMPSLMSALGVPPTFSFNRSPLEQAIGMTYTQQRNMAMGGTFTGVALNVANQFGAVGRYAEGILDPTGRAGVAGGLFDAMRFMPGGGILNMAGSSQMANMLSQQMTPEALGTRLWGSEVGQMTSDLGRRGLLPGRMEDLQNVSTRTDATQKFSERVGEWSKVVEGLQDIFGKDKAVDKLMQQLDSMTGGGVSGGGGAANMRNVVEKVRGISLMTGMSPDMVANIGAYGASAGQQMGLIGGVGSAMAMQGILTGMGMTMSDNGNEYFGKLSTEQNMSVAQGRLITGAASPLARIGGGLLGAIKMRAEMNGIVGASSMAPSELAAALGGSAQLQQYARMFESGADPAGIARAFNSSNIPGLSQALGSIGVGSTTAYDLLTNNTAAGQEMIAKYGARSIMGAQDSMVFEELANPVARTLMDRFRGMGSDKARQLALGAMSSLSQAGNFSDRPEALDTVRRSLGGYGSAAGDVYQSIYGAASDPKWKSLGGPEAIFNRAHGDALIARTQAFLGPVISGLMDRGGEGQPTTPGAAIMSRIVNDIMRPGLKGSDAEGVFDRYIGKGKYDRDAAGAFYQASQDAAQAQKDLMAGRITRGQAEDARTKYATAWNKFTDVSGKFGGGREINAEIWNTIGKEYAEAEKTAESQSVTIANVVQTKEVSDSVFARKSEAAELLETRRDKDDGSINGNTTGTRLTR